MEQEMKVYQKSLELAFGAYDWDVRGAIGNRNWIESVKRTCAAVSLNIAKGGALYPRPECLEHWRTAELAMREIFLLLDLGFEENLIFAEQRLQMTRQLDEIGRMLRALVIGIQPPGDEN